MDDETRGSVPTTCRAAVGIGAKFAAFAALLAGGAGAAVVQAAPEPTVRLLASNMVGAKEVPSTSGDPNGRVNAEFDIKNGNVICARFRVQSLSPGSVIQGTHIHKGTAGVNGLIRVDFGGKLNKCVTVPKSLANQIKTSPSGWYANLHTNLYPSGAVRAQLRKGPPKG